MSGGHKRNLTIARVTDIPKVVEMDITNSNYYKSVHIIVKIKMEKVVGYYIRTGILVPMQAPIIEKSTETASE